MPAPMEMESVSPGDLHTAIDFVALCMRARMWVHQVTTDTHVAGEPVTEDWTVTRHKLESARKAGLQYVLTTEKRRLGEVAAAGVS